MPIYNQLIRRFTDVLIEIVIIGSVKKNIF